MEREMARKALGKTSSRTMRKEFNKKNPLPESLYFLKDVKFTSVATVTLPGKEKESTLVEFTPKQIEEIFKMAARRMGRAMPLTSVQKKLLTDSDRVKAAKEYAEKVSNQCKKLESEKEELELKLELELKKAYRLVKHAQQDINTMGMTVSDAKDSAARLTEKNRKLQDQLDRLLGKDAIKIKSATDLQNSTIDPSPYRHRMPGSHS